MSYAEPTVEIFAGNDEAARLMSMAARALPPLPDAAPAFPAASGHLPLIAERDRALRPASNQNGEASALPTYEWTAASRAYHASRLIVRITLLPLQVAVAAGAIALNAVFIKGLLGF